MSGGSTVVCLFFEPLAECSLCFIDITEAAIGVRGNVADCSRLFSLGFFLLDAQPLNEVCRVVYGTNAHCVTHRFELF